MAAFEILSEIILRVQIDAATPGDPCHQQVLFVGHAGLFVIDDLVIAIEGQPVLDVAADAKNGNRLVSGGKAGQPFRQRARLVGAIEEVHYSF